MSKKSFSADSGEYPAHPPVVLNPCRLLLIRQVGQQDFALPPLPMPGMGDEI